MPATKKCMDHSYGWKKNILIDFDVQGYTLSVLHYYFLYHVN